MRRDRSSASRPRRCRRSTGSPRACRTSLVMNQRYYRRSPRRGRARADPAAGRRRHAARDLRPAGRHPHPRRRGHGPGDLRRGAACATRPNRSARAIASSCSSPAGRSRTASRCFGLCRGLQVINVALGGTLYQDLEAQCARRDQARLLPDRRLRARPPGARGRGRLRLAPATRSWSARSSGEQHAPSGDQGPGAGPGRHRGGARWADRGIEIPAATFLVGVQWHPESLTDRDTRMHRLLTGFVEAAARSTWRT